MRLDDIPGVVFGGPNVLMGFVDGKKWEEEHDGGRPASYYTVEKRAARSHSVELSPRCVLALPPYSILSSLQARARRAGGTRVRVIDSSGP
jgi:hypothetical protein